jgi:flagellar hook-associated protein FlgK
MGILTSMFTAVTGLSSYGNAMGVIGNNIANVGTAGFKSSRATFLRPDFIQPGRWLGQRSNRSRRIPQRCADQFLPRVDDHHRQYLRPGD